MCIRVRLNTRYCKSNTSAGLFFTDNMTVGGTRLKGYGRGVTKGPDESPPVTMQCIAILLNFKCFVRPISLRSIAPLSNVYLICTQRQRYYYCEVQPKSETVRRRPRKSHDSDMLLIRNCKGQNTGGAQQLRKGWWVK